MAINFGGNSVIDLSKIGFGIDDGFDADALSYFPEASITSATQKNAVNTFVVELKGNNVLGTNVYAKGKDIGLFISGDGSIAKALVKIKSPAGLESFLNNGSAAFTDTHYSDALGLRNPSGTRKADTGFILTSNGLSRDDFSVITAVTEHINNTNNSFMLDNKVSGGASLYFQKTGFGLSAGSVGVLSALSASVPYVKTMSSNGSVYFKHDYRTHYLPTAIPAISVDTSISLFSGMSFGAVTNIAIGIGFNWIGEYLTPAETDVVVTAVRRLLTALGRSAVTKDFVGFGDSNTVGAILGSGNGPTTVGGRFFNLLCTNLGLKEANAGVGGSRYRADGVSIAGGYPNRAEILKYDILSGGMVGLFYGTNDCTNDTGDGVNYPDFQTKLETHIDELIAYGMALDKIVVWSLPPITNTVTHTLTKQTNYRDAAFNAASGKGVIFADVFNYLLDNGGTAANIGPDGLHMNDTGHDNAFDCILAAINA